MKVTNFNAAAPSNLGGGTLVPGSGASGDLGGTLPAPTVVGIGGIPVDTPDGVATDYLNGAGHWTVPAGSTLGSATPLVESGSGTAGTAADASREDHVHPAAGGGGGGGLVLLEQHTASASATLDFTTCISSTYDDYQIELVNVLPATDSVTLSLRFSTDGGSSYIATGYQWAHLFVYGGSPANGWEGQSSDTGIAVGGGGISNSNAGVCGSIRLPSPGLAGTTFKSVTMDTTRYVGSIPALVHDSASGGSLSVGAVNAFRFLFSAGNLASGTIRVYGIAK